MKKLLSVSLAAIMTVGGAYAMTERPTRISDIVRELEASPELIEEVSDAIIIARASKIQAAGTPKKFDGNVAKRIDTSKLTLGNTNNKLADKNTPEMEQSMHQDENGNYIPDSIQDVADLTADCSKLCNQTSYVAAKTMIFDSWGNGSITQGMFADLNSAIENCRNASVCK